MIGLHDAVVRGKRRYESFDRAAGVALLLLWQMRSQAAVELRAYEDNERSRRECEMGRALAQRHWRNLVMERERLANQVAAAVGAARAAKEPPVCWICDPGPCLGGCEDGACRYQKPL